MFKKCKYSHGRCYTCSLDNGIPHYARKPPGNYDPRKSWPKQKGFRKEFQRWFAEELRSLQPQKV